MNKGYLIFVKYIINLPNEILSYKQAYCSTWEDLVFKIEQLESDLYIVNSKGKAFYFWEYYDMDEVFYTLQQKSQWVSKVNDFNIEFISINKI